MSGRKLGPVERAAGWIVGVPFASWRYLAREMEIRHDEVACPWPMEGFGDEPKDHPGEPQTLQRPSVGRGPAFNRLYRVQVQAPVLTAEELMAVVLADPNVACPLEIARFERDREGPLQVGEEMRVRLPGPWNGPVRVIDADRSSFRLATLPGHLEAGEIEFRAGNETYGLLFEIESWARSGSWVFHLLYDRLGIGRALQLDMWAFFLERAAQISGGRATAGIEICTRRCDDPQL